MWNTFSVCVCVLAGCTRLSLSAWVSFALHLDRAGTKGQTLTQQAERALAHWLPSHARPHMPTRTRTRARMLAAGLQSTVSWSWLGCRETEGEQRKDRSRQRDAEIEREGERERERERGEWKKKWKRSGDGSWCFPPSSCCLISLHVVLSLYLGLSRAHFHPPMPLHI